MLSDNIRNYRKENNMSQDELAEKLGVSRQSVSLWETGQSQPTIDNIIALTKIFNVSTDAILGTADNAVEVFDGSSELADTQDTQETPETQETQELAECLPDEEKKRRKLIIIVASAVSAALIIGGVIWFAVSRSTSSAADDTDTEISTEITTDAQTEDTTSLSAAETTDTEALSAEAADTNADSYETEAYAAPQAPQPAETQAPQASAPQSAAPQAPQSSNSFDLFTYCKEYAIRVGALNGDYTMYQQPATLYGGYANEYFSISYWGDSDMVEFCLHCPLSDTYSENFYLRMRGGYYNKYDYLTSKYFRSDGQSLRSATGYIDPSVFSDSYPLNCDAYQGSTDGQNSFMEESRVGMCDLIHCLKNFVAVENMGVDFSVFGFVNY